MESKKPAGSSPLETGQKALTGPEKMARIQSLLSRMFENRTAEEVLTSALNRGNCPKKEERKCITWFVSLADKDPENDLITSVLNMVKDAKYGSEELKETLEQRIGSPIVEAYILADNN